MLETSIERVKLLKAGISGKKIEELYIKCNNFTIVHSLCFGSMSKSILQKIVIS